MEINWKSLAKAYEAASLYASGLSIKEIALRLNKHERTIRQYLKRYYEHIKQNT